MKRIKEILKAMPREKEMEAREKIGVAMWPKATPLQRCINLQNIMTGRTTRITPDGIKIIASILGVTPNDILEWDGENIARETVKTA